MRTSDSDREKGSGRKKTVGQAGGEALAMTDLVSGTRRHTWAPVGFPSPASSSGRATSASWPHPGPQTGSSHTVGVGQHRFCH